MRLGPSPTLRREMVVSGPVPSPSGRDMSRVERASPRCRDPLGERRASYPVELLSQGSASGSSRRIRSRCENRRMPPNQPLAARMRPRDLDEFVGQAHLVGKGRGLRKAMEAGQLPSMILWGPPGTGKTTLAPLGAKRTQSRFVAISAVASGGAELRKIIEESRKLRGPTNQGPVLFIDEIHRFNKAQQDVA